MLRIIFILLVTTYACSNNNSAPAAKVESANSVQENDANRKIEILDPEGLNIIDSSAAIEVIARGFEWTEGPLFIGEGNYFIFSDIPNNRINKWKEGDSTSVYLQPSGYTGTTSKAKETGSNGLALHPDGHLVLMMQGDRRIGKMTAPLSNPKPEFITLADRFEGKRLNSPNDGVYHPNGDFYFTDPPYGLAGGLEDTTKELDFQGVYRLKPNGQLDLVTKELKFPNGIAISPDGKQLYVASSDNENMIWMQYELNEKGLIKSQRVFYDAQQYEGKNKGAPDGMKMSKSGHLFASGPEGVWIFNSAGKVLAKIHTGQFTSNCALTPDEKMLYMTCDDYIMRVNLK
jgi:gluconolactonase